MKKMIDGLLAELEQEAETTRRVLERIPQAHLSWKPHPKSMSLGQLALHVATVPGNVAELAAMDTIPEPPSFVQPEAASAAELVPTLRDSVTRARTRAGRIRRLQDGGDVAAAERRPGHPGHAASRRRPRDHAEPLVPPPRSAARLSTAAQSIGAVGIRADRRREPVQSSRPGRLKRGLALRLTDGALQGHRSDNCVASGLSRKAVAVANPWIASRSRKPPSMPEAAGQNVRAGGEPTVEQTTNRNAGERDHLAARGEARTAFDPCRSRSARSGLLRTHAGSG